MLKLYPFLFDKDKLPRRLSIAAFMVSLLCMVLFDGNYSAKQQMNQEQQIKTNKIEHKTQTAVEQMKKKKNDLQVKGDLNAQKSIKIKQTAKEQSEQVVNKTAATERSKQNDGNQQGANIELVLKLDKSQVIRNIGWFEHPIYKDWRMHNGIDIKAREVKAVSDGKVMSIIRQPFWGSEIQVDTKSGFRVIYGYLKVVKVYTGQMVEIGQLMGQIAPSEGDNTSHMHIEVWKDNQSFNPMDFVK